MQFPQVLLVLLGFVILGLSFYLAWLLLMLKRQRRASSEVQRDLDASNQTQHDQRIKSMEMIALAALQGDCELSEACIRIKKLLDYYPQLAAEDRYRVIHAMFDEIKGFDTHEARQALPSEALREQDRQREVIEEKYRDLLLESFRDLAERMRALQGSHFDLEREGNVVRS